MRQTNAQTFEQLQQVFSLSDQQKNLFERYANLLQNHANLYNLTTRSSLSEIIDYHFADSLAVTQLHNFAIRKGCIDVGTGAGFPGVPLKILFPDTPFILIEVLAKRRKFLELLINELQLLNVTIYEADWRTFLRKSSFEASVVVCRASLSIDELLRMFRPSSTYQEATLYYWGSREWACSDNEKKWYQGSEWYTLSERTRQIAIFQKSIQEKK